MIRYSFSIDIEPVAKGRPRFAMGGKFPRAYTPEKTKNYETQIGYICKTIIKNPIKDIPLFLSAKFYMPIPKSLSKKKREELVGKWHTSKPDTDNLLKAICDGMNGIVWQDDSQVAKIESYKQYSLKPRVDIIIEELLQ